MIKEGQREENFKKIQDVRRRKEEILKLAIINDPDLYITLAKLQNEMTEELAKQEKTLEIVFFGDNKAKH